MRRQRESSEACGTAPEDPIRSARRRSRPDLHHVNLHHDHGLGAMSEQPVACASVVVVEDRLARALSCDDVADHAVPVTPPELPSRVELRAPTNEGLLDCSLDLLLARGAGGRGHAANLRAGVTHHRALFGRPVDSVIECASVRRSARTFQRHQRSLPSGRAPVGGPSTRRRQGSSSRRRRGQGSRRER